MSDDKEQEEIEIEEPEIQFVKESEDIEIQSSVIEKMKKKKEEYREENSN